MSTPKKETSTLAGRLWLIAMGLAFAGMGLLIGWYLLAFFKNSSRTDDWVKVPATITKSEIDNSQLTQHYAMKYRLDVKYDYEYEGKNYTGDRIKRLAVEGASLKKIEGKQEDFPVGLETTCLVNPANPEEAFLKADTKAAIYSIWFPGLFVIGGVGMIVAAIFKKSGKAQPADDEN